MGRNDWRRVKLTPAVRQEINRQVRKMMYSKEYKDYLVGVIMNVIGLNRKAIVKMLVKGLNKEMKGVMRGVIARVVEEKRKDK